MTRLGAAITEAIVYDYGAAAFLSQLSDPFDGNKHSLIIDLSRSSASFQSQNKSAGRCWQARRSDNSLTTGSVRRCLGTRYVRVAGITCPIESADAIPIPRIFRQPAAVERGDVRTDGRNLRKVRAAIAGAAFDAEVLLVIGIVRPRQIDLRR